MSQGLETLTQAHLMQWVEQARRKAVYGQVVDRIAGLTAARSDWFAVCVASGAGQILSSGDSDRMFPLMSVIKPFVLLCLLEQFGREAVFQWVGADPSDLPFNSLEQLIADRGRPRNPMLNSGAIVLAAKLPGSDGRDRCLKLCDWLNQKAGCHLKLDEVMLASVRLAGRGINQAIADYLCQSGHLANPEQTLDTYEQICCLSGQVMDLAQLGNLLAQERGLVKRSHRQMVNALMLTAGLYEASGRYALRVGLPMKSGISGALLTVVPHQGAIACYSPALDLFGNPVGGLAFVEALAQVTELSVFG
jgi:glutaminase